MNITSQMNCQKKKFNLNKKYTYLNCAYMSPLLKKVEKAGIEGLKAKRYPYKVTGDDFFKSPETLRLLFSNLINNPEPNRIALIPSVSYGVANVVNNIPLAEGENVVIPDGQFPSNVYPWKNHCNKNNATLNIISAPDTEEKRGDKWNADILGAINGQTKIVAISHVHWADGTMFHLKELRKRCDEVGAALIVDGTQSVGALPFDIQEFKPDALVVAGYKWMMGAYTSGLAYYGSRFDGGVPIEQNWINRLHSDDFTNLVNYQDSYREGAVRYDMGQKSSFINNPMLIAAIKQLRKWGVENIQQYCVDLIKDSLEEIKDLNLYVEDDTARGAHLFGVKFPMDKMESLDTHLRKNRVSVSIRGEFIRVTPNVYNDERDMNKFIRMLKDVI